MPASALVKSLTRGLVILEVLARAEDGLTLAQLCSELKLKPPTMHNLLRTLAARGYVEKRTKPTRYELGMTLFDMVDQYRNQAVQQRAAQIVGQIFAQFGTLRVAYVEAVGDEVLLKLRMTPERPGLLERPWHAIMLPYTSASVLVFQAFWPHEKRQAYRRRYPFADYGARVWQTEADLEIFLAQVREQGYAAPPVDRAGLYRLAVPVFSPRNALIAALGVAVSTAEVDDFDALETEVIPALQAGAAALFEEG